MNRRDVIRALEESRYWPPTDVLEGLHPTPLERSELLWGLVRDGLVTHKRYVRALADYPEAADVRVAVRLVEAVVKSDDERMYHNSVEGFDSEIEELFGKLAEQCPEDLLDRLSTIPEPFDDLAAVCLARAGKLSPTPEKALRRVAKAWLSNASRDPWHLKWFDVRAALASPEEWAKMCRDVAIEDGFTIRSWENLETALDGASPEDVIRAVVNNGDDHFRKQAVEALTKLGPGAIPMIRKALPKAAAIEDWRADRGVALALGLSALYAAKGEPAPEKLDASLLADLKGYFDTDIDVVIGALSRLPQDRASALLARALKEASSDGPRAILALSAAPDGAVVDAAIEHAKRIQKDERKAEVVARGIAACGRQATAPLIKALEAKLPSITAELYARALAGIGDPAAAKALVGLLGHSIKGVRSAAQKGLYDLGEDARAAVEEGAKAKKAAIREACDEIRAKLNEGRGAGPGEARSGGPLDALLAREAALSEADRASIRAALEEGKDHHGRAKLDAALGERRALVLAAGHAWFTEGIHQDYKIRDVFRHILHTLKGDEEAAWIAVDIFAKLPSFYPAFVREITRPLGDYGPALVRPIEHVFNGPAPALREDLYELLVKHGPKQGKAALLRGMKDSGKGVRGICAEALAAFGAEVAPDAIALMAEKKKDLRLSAAELLARVTDPGFGQEEKDKVFVLLAAEKVPEVATALERAVAALGKEPPAQGKAKAPSKEGKSDPQPAEAVDVDALLAKEIKAKLPKFLSIEELPPIRLKDGAPLSAAARHGLLSRLMKEGPDHIDPVARWARAGLNDDDCNAWALAIKDAWAKAGGAAKDKWAIYQQGILANEDRLSAVAPRLEDVVSAGQHHLASWYLDVCARHGSVAGLSWVGHWAAHARKASLRSKTQALLSALAEAEGISEEALASRMNRYILDDVEDAKIPRLDFDKQGRQTLDYGGRTLGVELDQSLELLIRDEAGKAHTAKNLPKARPDDDAAKVEAAKAAVKALRDTLKATVTEQAQRLEGAMVSGRVYKMSAFRQLFIEHPIMAALGAGLVFHVVGPSGTLFRVDRARPGKELVGLGDAPVTIDEASRIGIVHPAEMTAEQRAAWKTELASLGLTQPFQQLDRPLFAPAGDDDLEREAAVRRGTLASRLNSLGFTAGTPEDAGIVYEAFCLMPGRGVRVRVDHGGYSAGSPSWDNKPVDVRLTFQALSGESLSPEEVGAVAFSEARLALSRLLDE